MEFKVFKKLLKAQESLVRDKVAKLYLATLFSITIIFLMIYSLYLNDYKLAIFSQICTVLLLIYFYSNSKRKTQSFLLDRGVMIKPFEGLSVFELLKGPKNIVVKNKEVFPVSIGLVAWLYFCVLAIVKSGKEKFHYHSHLVETINKQCPELISWLPEMYKIHNSVPPIPNEITVEDFQ